MNPLHLLRLEWQRFAPNATFRIVAALYLGFFALALFLVLMIGENMVLNTNGTAYKPMDDLFEYPRSWQILAWIGSWMNVFLLGFLGVFMATLEFSNRTLRQSILFGMTRLEAAVSKLLSAGALALVATVLYVLFGLAFLLVGGKGPSLPPVVSLIGFFLQAFGYLGLGLLIGVFLRQTALATLLYLAYVLFLEMAARWLFFAFTKSQALRFLPDAILEDLAALPLPESMAKYFAPLPPAAVLGLASAYLALIAFLLCHRLAKADL